jgi:hypothetical protein
MRVSQHVTILHSLIPFKLIANKYTNLDLKYLRTRQYKLSTDKLRKKHYTKPAPLTYRYNR